MILNTDRARVHRWFCHLPSGQVSQRLFELTKGATLDRKSLVWYLTLGYVPGNKTLFKDIECLPGDAKLEVHPGEWKEVARGRYEELVSNDFEEWDEESLIRHGVETWQKAMSRLYAESPGDHVVPISGGLDSRAVLSGMLEHREASTINTFTFGTPGTWDYNIASQLAKLAGTRHTTYDLSKIPFNQKRLDLITDLIDGIAHVGRPHDRIAADFGPSAIGWSGFFGGSTGGANLPRSLAYDPGHYFLSRNRYAKSEIDLADALLGESITVKDLDKVREGMPQPTHDTFDLYHRQERYVAHVCFPRGLTWKAPFLDTQWLKFTLSLALEHRQDQKLYKKILVRAFPTFFSLPTRNSHGEPLKESRAGGSIYRRVRRNVSPLIWRLTKKLAGKAFVNPEIEYINYSHDIRHRKDLHNLVKENLGGLKNRQLLRNTAIDLLWKEHQSEVCAHPRALLLLTCLESILQNAEGK